MVASLLTVCIDTLLQPRLLTNFAARTIFVSASCPCELVNLAVVGEKLQNRNKINQNKIIELLTHYTYLENTKFVWQVIFWKHV